MPYMKHAEINNCFAHDPKMILHDEAIGIIRQACTLRVNSETVALDQSLGRVVSQPLEVPNPVPNHRNSAVDGYSFMMVDISASQSEARVLEVTHRIAAGDTPLNRCEGAARIFTGAALPHNHDCIVMQEDCQPVIRSDKEWVKLPEGLKVGSNIRQAGEDLSIGQLLADRHHVISPADIAAFATCGIQTLKVFEPLRVALFSNGKELVRSPGILKPGQVYDANAPMLGALGQHLPLQIHDMGILPDQYGLVADAILDAAQTHDVLITTAGASGGEEDYVKRVIAEHGDCLVQRLAVKPGRPLGFGRVGDTPIFALPGNPVAGFVCFLLYVRPALLAMGGANWQTSQGYLVPSGFSKSDIKSARREFWRGYIEHTPHGPYLKKFERDGSGLITGLRHSTGLIEIDEATTHVAQGDLLRFHPYSELGGS